MTVPRKTKESPMNEESMDTLLRRIEQKLDEVLKVVRVMPTQTVARKRKTQPSVADDWGSDGDSAREGFPY